MIVNPFPEDLLDFNHLDVSKRSRSQIRTPCIESPSNKHLYLKSEHLADQSPLKTVPDFEWSYTNGVDKDNTDTTDIFDLDKTTEYSERMALVRKLIRVR